VIIASLRVVVPVGDWDDARFALPGGQSGNPLSRHWADLVHDWANGGHFGLETDRERLRANGSVLILEPR
jgi:penicillin G amidase